MTQQELEAYDAMMADRDRWKANHDNQVAIKRIIAARPDLKERAPMVEKLMAERNRAQAHSIRQHARIKELESVIRETIMENLHLADGDVCTLKRLKDAIGFELPPENASAMAKTLADISIKTGWELCDPNSELY